MTRLLMAALAGICLVGVLFAKAPLGETAHPGAERFTPTRIDWLTTALQADLREDITNEHPFLLAITHSDSETILIYVRYRPDVDPRNMNLEIETARKVIQMTAKSYGWDSWLKVREDVQMAKGGSE
jgi:hypothetical protein